MHVEGKGILGGVGQVSFLLITSPEEWLLHLSSFGGSLPTSENRGGSQSPRALGPNYQPQGCCLQLSLVRFLCFVLKAGVFFWQRAWHPLRVSGTTLTEGRESVGLGSWGFIEFALKSYRVVLAKEAFLMNPRIDDHMCLPRTGEGGQQGDQGFCLTLWCSFLRL